MKKILLSIAAFLTVLAGGYGASGLLGGDSYVKTSYDVIGSPTASSTLTASYSGNSSVQFVKGLENLHLDVGYTPASFNSALSILIEGSNDGGVNYYPLSSKSVGSTDIKIYQEGVSSTLGIPITYPGDSTTASGTMYRAMMDFDLVADYVRVSVRENTTSTYGVVQIRGTFTQKN